MLLPFRDEAPAVATARTTTPQRPAFRYGTPLAVAFLTAIYLALIAGPIARHLWFDELFTFYIAQSRTLTGLMDALTHVDLNPPLIYLLVRLSHGLFGVSEIATRIPAALAFYLGCIGLFFFLKRRIGVAWSCAAILLFWSTDYIRYAVLARPYGLILAFFSLSLLSYDALASSKPNRQVLWGLAAGNIGMMISHVFAPLSILPFCAAELVRSFRVKRIDWAVWASLVLPVLIFLVYVPATHNFQQIYFPKGYQASTEQILYFYLRLGVINLFIPIGAALIPTLAAIPFTPGGPRRLPGNPPAAAAALVFITIPVALNLVLMRTGGAFWDRYCITSALMFYVLVLVAIGWLTGNRLSCALAMTGVLCCTALTREYDSDSQAPWSGEWKSIRQDLPLVSASGLTFLELDHYESASFASRLHYLVDRDSAIRYTHATIFENMPLLKSYFPIRANVSAYDRFIAKHRHFLVLARADSIEEWILHRLCADGATIKLRKNLHGPSRDFQLYEVWW